MTKNPKEPTGTDSVVGLLAGKYRIQRELGRGGMGLVYEADEIDLHVKAAVKVLAPKFWNQPEHSERFMQEAKNVAKVQHEGVVRIDSVGKLANDVPYFRMELLTGLSLADAIQDTGGAPFEIVRALDLGRQIASAMAAVHAERILHKDLKPSNVMLIRGADGQSEKVKLIDFGISTQTDSSEPIIDARGTPGYKSPEQHGESALTSKTDVYSLGCILFELLSGKPVFPGSSNTTLAQEHQGTTPISVRQLNALVPIDVDSLLQRMLAKQPELRPSMADVGATLSAVLTPRAEPQQRKSRAPRLVLLALLGVAVVSRLLAIRESEKGMVRITGGRFQLGSTAQELANVRATLPDRPQRERDLYQDQTLDILGRESPTRLITLNDFQMDRYEVSCREFAMWLDKKEFSGGVKPRRLPAQDGAVEQVYSRNNRIYSLSAKRRVPCIRYERGHYVVEPTLSDFPISAVSWDGASQYCAEHDKRLPTEAEWEYAARGKSRRSFPWGNELPTCKSALLARGLNLEWDQCGVSGPMPRGSFPRDCTPEGVCDLAGSLQEWVIDVYLPRYPDCEKTGCIDPRARSEDSQQGSESIRVIRGGAWSMNLLAARSTERVGHDKDTMDSYIGFRCVKSVR